MKRKDLMSRDLNYRHVKIIFTSNKTKKGILNYCYTNFNYYLTNKRVKHLKLDLRKVKDIILL